MSKNFGRQARARQYLGLAVFAAALWTPAMASPSRPIDRILVVVADEIVLVSDLQKSVEVTTAKRTTLTPSGKLMGGSITPTEVENVLDQLINQRIISIKTRELGLQVTEEELSSEIDTFLRNQNLTEEKLQESLRAEGETYENYREEFRRQVETQRVIGRLIRPTVSVTDDDVRSFYLQQPGVAEKQQRVKLRSLSINLAPSLSQQTLADNRNHIAKIEREIRDATDPASVNFEQLVRLYSSDPEVIKTGGMLPPKELKDLPAEVRAKIGPTTKSGSIIGPISLGSSMFFFQFLGTVLTNESEYDKQKNQLKNMLLDAKGNERMNEFLRAERTKTKIERREFKITR